MYIFAKKKQSEFFWAGKIGYYHEMYLNISISFAFNLSVLSFKSVELGFNTLFCVFIGVNAVLIPLISCIVLYLKLRKATHEEKGSSIV